MTDPCGCSQTGRPWRIVFFGTPEFALPTLKALAEGPDEVALVVTAPPAPAGRGRKLTPSPVAVAAAEIGLKILEAKSLRDEETLAAIEAVHPDLLVVAAFGGFLPERLLKLCPYPPLNIHPSLLPRHRGAAPVNWCLINGDQESGVSIIFLEEKMDAGPILCQRSFPVDSCDSAGNWEARLAEVGADELLTVIEGLKNKTINPCAQDEAQATVNPLLCKGDGRVDWTRPADELAGLINGVDPWPGAQTSLQGKGLKVFGASASAEKAECGGTPGRVLRLDEDGRLLIQTGEGALALTAFQPEGKKRMSAAEFQRGYRPETLGS